MKQWVEPMIRDVYILKRSGEVIIHKAFSKRGVDEAIFSGFYSALSAFAEELGHGGIETIQMGDVSFYYEHSKDLLFAIAADKSHNAKDVQIVLTEIKRQFTENYADRVADWDGTPTPFQKFNKEIEGIVSVKHVTEGETGLYILPFAVDGAKLKGKTLDDTDINGDIILDPRLELAAVHLLLDDIRRNTTGLKPLNEGCFEFLTKLLWPIWIVSSPDNRILLIDGLKLLQPQVARGFVPPASRYEALLKVNASPEYLAVIEKLTEEVRTAARSTPFDLHVIPAELTQQLRHLARITNGNDQFGVQLPSQMNRDQANKEAEQFFTEAIETYKESSKQWTQFRTYFQKDVQKWKERIQTEIITLKDHYATRKADLKHEIDQAFVQIAKEEEAAMTEVEEWRQDQTQQILTPLKTSLSPIDQELIEQQSTLKRHLSDKKSKITDPETFLNQLTKALDQFDDFANDLRNLTKASRKEIQQTRRNLQDLDRQVQERKAQVRQRFATQEEQEAQQLDELDEERQDRLQETQDRLKQLEEYATEIDDLIQQHITHSNTQLTTFEHYLLEAGTPLPTDIKTPIYIPIYLAGLKQENDTTHLLVIPPIMVPPSKQVEKIPIGQRTVPVGALSSEMVQYLKTSLEAAFADDPKFAKQVTQLSPRHNLLSDPHIESLLYSGLHALWQAHLIPERVHTQIKLACIDMYRSSHTAC
ncbi:MAG: hypothetical protein ACFE8F_06530 [Promethearchaeota archaeon]